MGLPVDVWLKFSGLCIAATGIGYVVMKMTSPSRDQWIQQWTAAHARQPSDLSKLTAAENSQQQSTAMLLGHMNKNARSKRPIWEMESLSKQDIVELAPSSSSPSRSSSSPSSSTSGRLPTDTGKQ
jgi:hypothetical protein